MVKFDRCYKCRAIYPAKTLDGGLCWECAGLKKPPMSLIEIIEEDHDEVQQADDQTAAPTEQVPQDQGESGVPAPTAEALDQAKV